MATQSYKSLGTYLRVCPLFYELMLLCLSDTNGFYLLLSDYCHNKLAYSALLNNIDIIVIISYNVILFENKDFMC